MGRAIWGGAVYGVERYIYMGWSGIWGGAVWAVGAGLLEWAVRVGMLSRVEDTHVCAASVVVVGGVILRSISAPQPGGGAWQWRLAVVPGGGKAR